VIRILVTGSRTWTARGWIARELERAVRDLGGTLRSDVTLVSGACPRGADRIAEEHAAGWGWTIERHPALWDECGPGCPDRPHRIRRRAGDIDHPGALDTYCPKAGPRRNTLMVELGADRAVAFVVGKRWSGTRDCGTKAERAGIPTTWIEVL
jgi:hypothetical protein